MGSSSAELTTTTTTFIMRTQILASALVTGALAARPFLDMPDTGIELALGDTPEGQLPNVTTMVGLPDFEWMAEHYLPAENFTYYRNGASGEYSYRNNLEVFSRYRFKPRVMVDVSKLRDTLPTTMLGHNFSAPFYIAPCARANYAHKDAELNLVRGAAAGNILYMPSLYAAKTIEEIHAAKAEGQVVFQQLYLSGNLTAVQELFDRTKKAGADAIIFTVDSAAGSIRQRAARFGVTSANSAFQPFTWDFYKKLKTMTDLPIVLKGISSAADAKLAVKNGVPAIIISNHGGRQLDGAPSALEIALEIQKEAPEVFKKIEVWADGGIRYGGDALRLLALGVRAVGLGRPYMFANIFGQEGIERVTSLFKNELAVDAGNLGVADLKKINADYVNWTPNNWLP
ncbi:fmn-dependent dehydrogenase [Paramyrothecium foliicola]|nr:fmn-dependent dehydrogenase [Paramyrothecium foliicola]